VVCIVEGKERAINATGRGEKTEGRFDWIYGSSRETENGELSFHSVSFQHVDDVDSRRRNEKEMAARGLARVSYRETKTDSHLVDC